MLMAHGHPLSLRVQQRSEYSHQKWLGQYDTQLQHGQWWADIICCFRSVAFLRVCILSEHSLDVLHKRVAPNGILNAAGRADSVRCYPGTREEVIHRIEKWGDAQDGLSAPLFWLSGPAGAGKTAIVQTVAERCTQRRVPHANFFFFRADSSRRDASPLIATLLHQLILHYPSLLGLVATLLSAHPVIFDSALEEQLAQLIVAPLRAVQQSSPGYRPLLLLIDGLDECGPESTHSQQHILHAFDTFLAEPSCPFRLLVASRDEAQIRAAFNSISAQCIHLYLNNQYSAESDIWVFVNAQFAQVKRTHPIAHTLDAAWPSAMDVDYIVEKSSGQFIYAATVMRFILDSPASPRDSLERVKGVAQLPTKSPLSHLDAMYTHILSQADDQAALKDILHAQSLLRISERAPCPLGRLSLPTTISIIELLWVYSPRYTHAVLLSCLADLAPIARYESTDSTSGSALLFHHASFADFLSDPSRSGAYFVDVPAFAGKILPVLWRFMGRGPCGDHCKCTYMCVDRTCDAM